MALKRKSKIHNKRCYHYGYQKQIAVSVGGVKITRHPLRLKNPKIIGPGCEKTGLWDFRPAQIKQGSHRLEKYLNIQDCLEKFLKIKFALKFFEEHAKALNFTLYRRIQHCLLRPKSVQNHGAFIFSNAV